MRFHKSAHAVHVTGRFMGFRRFAPTSLAATAGALARNHSCVCFAHLAVFVFAVHEQARLSKNKKQPPVIDRQL